MILEQLAQAVERLAPFFQILTSLGVLLGIGTAFIGFSRYSQERARDRAQQGKEYLSALRESIFISRPIFEDLNYLLKYELFYEMASNIANSTPVSTGINDVYDTTDKYIEFLIESAYFDAEDSVYSYYSYEDTRKEMRDSLRDRWNRFGVWDSQFVENSYGSNEGSVPVLFPLPLRPKLVELFKDHTSRIGTEIEPYRFDYPTLSRVLLSANRFFLSLEEKYRRYVLYVEHWTDHIADAGQEMLGDRLAEQYQLLARKTRPTPPPSEEQEPTQEHTEDEEQVSTQEHTEREERALAHEQADAKEQKPPDQDTLRDLIKNKMYAIRDPDQLKDRVTRRFVVAWYMDMYRQDVEAIDAVLEIVQIVTRTYLSKSNDELLTIREQEKGLDFKPLEETPQPEKMLQEAFDGLKPVLTEYDRESYHHLAKRIGKRAPHSS